MKKNFLVMLVVSIITTSTSAANLKQFVSDCAWGTGVGAVAGLASMALTDKPSQHTRNIAIGASLGLYAGIAMGLYRGQESAQSLEYSGVNVLPTSEGVVVGYTARF